MIGHNDSVRLVVGGSEFSGWLSVSVSAGIERQARDFSLSVTSRWPGGSDVPRRIRPGDACELYIGQDKVLTGWVDATPIRYDAQSVSVGVTGRSKTADLVDCSAIHSSGQWRGAKLERIAAALAQPYGVKVKTETATGAAFVEHAIQQGETVFESIDRMLGQRQILATDDADGCLVFASVGVDRADTALVLGENILSGDAALDYKDRFSEYRVKGQRAGDDSSFGTASSEAVGAATDTAAARKRVLVLKSSGQADAGRCRARAQYERAHRAARSLAAVYTVAGWRQADGSLWRPNLMVRVVDGLIGFDDDMLITETEYSLDDSGMTCRLRVAPKDGYLAARDE
jgi:prophage tail gpP-like protein